MMAATFLIGASVAFLIVGSLYRRIYPGVSSILLTVAFVLIILAALLIPATANADTVAHANGANNRMLILTDDKCDARTIGNAMINPQVALVISYYKQPNKDAPGYIVAAGCWTKASDLSVVVRWDPDGYLEQYDARRFLWRGK